MAAGAHPLSGAVLLRGASELAADGRALVQVHTYAGASPRALLTATAVLDALPSLHDDLDRASAALDDGLAAVVDASRGRLLAQGQGLLRGALLDPALPLDAKARAAAVGVRAAAATTGSGALLLHRWLFADATVRRRRRRRARGLRATETCREGMGVLGALYYD